MQTASDVAFHRSIDPSCGSSNPQKKWKKKNKEKKATEISTANGIQKKKSKKGNIKNASRSTGSMVGYHCPGCRAPVQDQEGLNAHCFTKHRKNRFAPEIVTFASEEEFYDWRAKLEREQHACWQLVQNHDSVQTKYFCCPSLKLPLKSGKSRLCTFFIKTTFSAVVTVRYCLFHFGHPPLTHTFAPGSTDMSSYQQPNSLTISKASDAREVVHSLEAPSPSYIAVIGKANKRVGKPGQRKSEGIPWYQCPKCPFLVRDQMELNTHCCLRHGKKYAARSETFATENDFYHWKATLEKEQNVSWILGETHKYGPIVARYFFCSSCNLAGTSTPTLCPSFLKATFYKKVTVRCCTSHVGHGQLGTDVDLRSELVPCQEPLTLTIPENLDPAQADHSSQLPSPSYVVVTKKAEKEVDNDHNSPGPSSTENLKQSVPIKMEVDIPIVLPSPPPPSNQTRNAFFTSAAKVHVPETQDNWAEILNTALSDPSLSIQYKMLLQCLVASNKDLKNVIAMMKPKRS
ncbi:hypothetical protein Aduo_000796 [Ancylostoma duodenale]